MFPFIYQIAIKFSSKEIKVLREQAFGEKVLPELLLSSLISPPPGHCPLKPTALCGEPQPPLWLRSTFNRLETLSQRCMKIDLVGTLALLPGLALPYRVPWSELGRGRSCSSISYHSSATCFLCVFFLVCFLRLNYLKMGKQQAGL